MKPPRSYRTIPRYSGETWQDMAYYKAHQAREIADDIIAHALDERIAGEDV